MIDRVVRPLALIASNVFIARTLARVVFSCFVANDGATHQKVSGCSDALFCFSRATAREVGDAPGFQLIHHRGHALAILAQGIFDARRNLRKNCSLNHAISFELAELNGECLRSDSTQGGLNLREAFGAGFEFEENGWFPTSTDNIERGAHRAVVVQAVNLLAVIREGFHGANVMECGRKRNEGGTWGEPTRFFLSLRGPVAR